MPGAGLALLVGISVVVPYVGAVVVTVPCVISTAFVTTPRLSRCGVPRVR